MGRFRKMCGSVWEDVWEDVWECMGRLGKMCGKVWEDVWEDVWEGLERCVRVCGKPTSSAVDAESYSTNIWCPLARCTRASIACLNQQKPHIIETSYTHRRMILFHHACSRYRL